MAALLFTCPTTGYRVQGWFDEPIPPSGEPPKFASIDCQACGRPHIVDLTLNPPNPPDPTGSASE